MIFILRCCIASTRQKRKLFFSCSHGCHNWCFCAKTGSKISWWCFFFNLVLFLMQMNGENKNWFFFSEFDTFFGSIFYFWMATVFICTNFSTLEIWNNLKISFDPISSTFIQKFSSYSVHWIMKGRKVITLT